MGGSDSGAVPHRDLYPVSPDLARNSARLAECAAPARRPQAARGRGGEPGVLALEYGGHHVGRSDLVLGHNEVRLTAPRCPRIVQLRTVQQYDQAGGLPLTLREIRKHRPAIKPAWLGQAGQGNHWHGELPRQQLERLGHLAAFPRRIIQRPGRLDHADLVDDHQP
jgi:hypothetical protein